MNKLSVNIFKKMFQKEAEIYFSKLGRDFEIDDYNKSYLNNLCYYFSDDIDFERKIGGSLRKGLLVFGDVGTGKSSSFDIIQNVVKKNNLNWLRFSKKSTIEIVTSYNESKLKEEIIRNCSKGKFYFDDLGAESKASNYGREDIFIRIFDFRYNEFKEKGVKTHVTTNYTFDEIIERYGFRIFDRFREMFNFLELTGKNRRIVENPKIN